MEMTIGFDMHCPWGHARIITAEEAVAGLKQFFELHGLDWDCSDYNPLAHHLEICHWVMGEEPDFDFYGLCPVDGEHPGLWYDDPPEFVEDRCWQVRLDDDVVFTTASEVGDEDDDGEDEDDDE
jgi:hypothetical protein